MFIFLKIYGRDWCRNEVIQVHPDGAQVVLAGRDATDARELLDWERHMLSSNRVFYRVVTIHESREPTHRLSDDGEELVLIEASERVD